VIRFRGFTTKYGRAGTLDVYPPFVWRASDIDGDGELTVLDIDHIIA
jgi:hypothetical protein